MKKKKTPAFWVGISVCLLLLILATAFIWFRLPAWRDFERLSGERYQGVFFSMFDIDTYSEEDFVTYRGVPTLIAGYRVRGWHDIDRYLTEILSSQNTVTDIFMGLDPGALWKSSHGDDERFAENLRRYFAPYVEARPDVSFEILLYAPSVRYWTDMTEKQLVEALGAYRRLSEELNAWENVKTFFVGWEEWLILNPGNYLDGLQTNAEVSRKIFLHTFCDKDYRIDLGNAADVTEGLKEVVRREKESPAVYPDLSDFCVVFFGDSVMVYNEGSYSIPGVVNGLTGAEVYNCGWGGVAATGSPLAGVNFNSLLGRFLQGNAEGLEENDFRQGLTGYWNRESRDKKLCFVVEYGLNDYFSGLEPEDSEDAYDTGTYAGALRTGIRSLQEAFPEAEILLLTPTYTTLFSNGEERQGEKGGKLTDYVEAARRVATDMDVYCLDNYADSGINSETCEKFLADGTHPNETGSLLLGRKILEFIQENMLEERP